MKHQVVKRDKITYYLTDTAVIAKVSLNQYISYNIYNSPSRSNLLEFKKKILSSKPTQYGNVVDHMDLAQKCKVVGTGVRKPEWVE